MPLIVEIPDTRGPERDYILGVLLDEFLGLRYERVATDRTDVQITHSDAPGLELRLPDVLLGTPDANWLTLASLPTQPLARWNTDDLSLAPTLVDPVVPVIYGDTDPRTARDGDILRLPVDIFGSAFFMLTRYEEMVKPDRDEHDRFPAWASLASQDGFLERPIVDEYVEILWSALKSLWPALTRKDQMPRTFVTCDVDNPYAAYTKSLRGTVRKVAGDLLKRRSLREAGRTLRNTLATRRGDYRHDPFDTFDWMMDVNEAAGNRVAFYFLVANTVPGLDGHYSIDERRIRELMRRMHERGHEIGLHGSYATYRNPDQMVAEATRLRHVMAEEGIEQEQIGARQHYLRWSQAVTPNAMSRAGLAYDTTVGYADRPGFRCGTSNPYTLFDVEKEKAVGLTEVPLIMMECSALSGRYMGLGRGLATRDYLRMLQERATRYGGVCTLLWHNSYFYVDADYSLYSDLVSAPR